MQKSESQIKLEIIAFLAALPGACFTTKVSGHFQGKGSHKIYRTGNDGVADIIGCYQGRGVAIEIKKPLGAKGGTSGATQRASQIAWQISWEQARGVYLIARSVDEVIKQFKAILPYAGA